jgi:hypothetical protein
VTDVLAVGRENGVSDQEDLGDEILDPGKKNKIGELLRLMSSTNNILDPISFVKSYLHQIYIFLEYPSRIQ